MYLECYEERKEKKNTLKEYLLQLALSQALSTLNNFIVTSEPWEVETMAFWTKGTTMQEGQGR